MDRMRWETSGPWWMASLSQYWLYCLETSSMWWLIVRMSSWIRLRRRDWSIQIIPNQGQLPVKDSKSPSHRKPVIIKPVSQIFEIGDSNPIRGKCGKFGRSFSFQKNKTQKMQKMRLTGLMWLALGDPQRVSIHERDAFSLSGDSSVTSHPDWGLFPRPSRFARSAYWVALALGFVMQVLKLWDGRVRWNLGSASCGSSRVWPPTLEDPGSCCGAPRDSGATSDYQQKNSKWHSLWEIHGFSTLGVAVIYRNPCHVRSAMEITIGPIIITLHHVIFQIQQCRM